MGARIETCDVVVIGGGPAGSAAALRLARRGLAVIQLERRDPAKPVVDELRSGEGLLPATQRELRALDIALDESAWTLSTINQLSVRWWNGRATEDRFPAQRSIAMINRARFDQTLVDVGRQHGVDVRQGWSARQLTHDAAGTCNGVWAIAADGTQVELRARLVIDAGGRNARSIMQHNLRSFLPDTQFMVVVQYFDHVADVQPGRWEMHFFGDAQLTVMQITPLAPDLVRCGLAVNLEVKERHQERPDTLFWQQLAHHPELQRRLSNSHQRRPYYARAGLAYRTRQIALPGLLLVGDATGYLNPILGDGIWASLRSAALASEVGYQALVSGDVSLRQLGRYAHCWEAERRMRWQIARLLLRGYDHPTLLAAPAYFAPLRRLLLNGLLHT